MGWGYVLQLNMFLPRTIEHKIKGYKGVLADKHDSDYSFFEYKHKQQHWQPRVDLFKEWLFTLFANIYIFCCWPIEMCAISKLSYCSSVAVKCTSFFEHETVVEIKPQVSMFDMALFGDGILNQNEAV